MFLHVWPGLALAKCRCMNPSVVVRCQEHLPMRRELPGDSRSRQCDHRAILYVFGFCVSCREHENSVCMALGQFVCRALGH